MAEAVHTSPTRFPYRIMAVLCLLPWGVPMAAQTSVPSIPQQIEQQRQEQAEFRRALEDSERRIAADQAEKLCQSPAFSNDDGVTPFSEMIFAVAHSSSRTNPNSKCRGSMCLAFRRSASSAP